MLLLWVQTSLVAHALELLANSMQARPITMRVPRPLHGGMHAYMA